MICLTSDRGFMRMLHRVEKGIIPRTRRRHTSGFGSAATTGGVESQAWRGQRPSNSSAIFNIFVTLFQLRAVPVTPSSFSTDDQGSLLLPAPLGK